MLPTSLHNRSYHHPANPGARRKPALQKAEAMLLWACLGLLVLALAGPFVAQDAHYHAFADQRAWWGLPHAMDVLSNLPFALFGVWGITRVVHMPASDVEGSQRSMALLFFVGLVVTTIGSSAYHWQPDNTGLLFDRMGMVAAFAGLTGLAAATRISARAGWWMACLVMATGPLGAWWCLQTGNLLPWAVVQGGGMLLVVCLAFVRPRAGALAVSLGQVIAIYALAKIFELMDAQLFALTGHWVSGHSLKHGIASCAAVPVLVALHRAARMPATAGAPRNLRQNPSVVQ